MSIFIFLKNAFEFFLLLSQGTTIPEIRIPGQKMWAGCYRIKLLHASGIRNRALSLLCRDLLGKYKDYIAENFGEFFLSPDLTPRECSKNYKS